MTGGGEGGDGALQVGVLHQDVVGVIRGDGEDAHTRVGERGGNRGQRADAATGLDYYNARYYDPLAGQFASADDVSDGLNRFGYVHGNPTSKDDPSGHGFSCLSIGSAYSAPSKVVAIAGCALDSFAVGIGVSSGGIARSLISATLRTRASGTFEYLTGSAGRALQAATSGKAIFWNSLRSLKDPRNILPGRASTAADIALDEVKSIVNNPANLRDPVSDPPPWGTKASRAFETFAEDTLPAYETTFKWIAKASKWLGAAGIALVGVAAGTDYYAHDSGDPTPLRIEKSVIAGVTHGAFAAAGAWIGGAVGGMIGGAIGGICGPFAIVCSTGLAIGFASAGAWGGDWLAGKAVDVMNSVASNAANVISNWWNNL